MTWTILHADILWQSFAGLFVPVTRSVQQRLTYGAGVVAASPSASTHYGVFERRSLSTAERAIKARRK